LPSGLNATLLMPPVWARREVKMSQD